MTDPVLELRKATKVYPGAVPVTAVDAVSLALAPGEIVALTGPSGSGKSTVLGLIGLLDVPTAGEVRIAGRDARRLDDAARSRLRAAHLGFVFQQFNLIGHLSARENVATALLYRGLSGRERLSRADAALDRVGLAARATHRPAQLSGGEQQRVALARAVVTQPDVILADEPTGNLDSDSTRNVLALLEGIAADGVAVVIATHDPEVAGRATRRAAMRDGRLAETADARVAPHA